jgi:hypothetical protein
MASGLVIGKLFLFTSEVGMKDNPPVHRCVKNLAFQNNFNTLDYSAHITLCFCLVGSSKYISLYLTTVSVISSQYCEFTGDAHL